MWGKLLTGAAAAGIGGRMAAKQVAKDQFGFGTTPGHAFEEVPENVLKLVEEDFGSQFGGDLSMMVLEHYKTTGDLIKYEEINNEVVKVLKDRYLEAITTPQNEEI